MNAATDICAKSCPLMLLPEVLEGTMREGIVGSCRWVPGCM